MPFFAAAPMVVKNARGAEITMAQGQEATRRIRLLCIQSCQLPVMSEGITAISTAAPTMAGV